MTAETVLQNVLLEIGRDQQGVSVGSSDYDVRQIVRLMNAAGQDIAGRAEWSRLFVTWEVGGGISAANLPEDFHELAEAGAVRINKAGFHPVRAVLAPEMWAMLRARPSQQPYFHLSGGKIHFSPALSYDGAVVRYVSKNWVENRDRITQNGDMINVPEKLVEKGAIWRWRRQKGLPFDDQMAEFEADLATEIAADRGRA